MGTEISKNTEVYQELASSRQQKIEKLYQVDTLLVLFWIGMLWVTLIFVYFGVAKFAPGFSKIIALTVGIMLGVFSTVALLAVNTHLKRNKTDLYMEDIINLERQQLAKTMPIVEPSCSKPAVNQQAFEKQSTEVIAREKFTIMKAFDIFFILGLCYISLLLPILLRGTVIVGSGEAAGMDYSFDPLAFVLVVLSFFGYVIYLLRNSDKELRALVNNVYGKKEAAK
jgi:hypothetical protein